MYRRYYLEAGWALVMTGIFERVNGAQDAEEDETNADTVACAGAVTGDDYEEELEPIEFEDSGAVVTESFELESGLLVAEGTYEGESNFIVSLVGEDRDYLLFNAIGEYEGAAGDLPGAGEYLLDVDADGDWSITIRQPRANEDDAELLPQTLECEGATWAGPYLFEGLTEAIGTHEGESNFIVHVIPEEALFPELVFNEIGEFVGGTTFRAEGLGYVVTDADGPWSLEIQ